MKVENSIRNGVFVALALAAVAAAASLYAQTSGIYKWTDENGVVHFSDMKPADTDSQNLEVDHRTGFSKVAKDDNTTASADAAAPGENGEAPLSAAQQRRQEIAESRDAQRFEQAEIRLWCQKHEKRLLEMEPARRVYTYDENGRQVRMDDDTRVALIEESKAYLSENCQ